MIQVERNGQIYQLNYAEHLIHHKNLQSVLNNGILSHNEVYQKSLINNDIADNDVQKIRDDRRDKIHRRPIHDYVSFYFNTKNPMLYKRRNIQHELIILLVDIDVINNQNTVFTDGNSANLHPNPTKFYSGQENLVNIPFETIFADSWNDENPEIKKENVRKRCSEILAYPSVSVTQIKKIACPNQTMVEYVSNLKNQYPQTASHIQIELMQGYFF
jgi:hypothetical protein